MYNTEVMPHVRPITEWISFGYSRGRDYENRGRVQAPLLLIFINQTARAKNGMYILKRPDSATFQIPLQSLSPLPAATTTLIYWERGFVAIRVKPVVQLQIPIVTLDSDVHYRNISEWLD